MKLIFFLRSYGDYTVALNSFFKADSADQYALIVSAHLKPLHEAIIPFLPPQLLNIEFLDFGIQQGLLSCFTNRYLCSFNAVKEVLNIRSFIQKNYKRIASEHEFYLEQYKRAGLVNLITSTSFKIIHGKKQINIYDSFDSFFQVKKKPYWGTDFSLNAESAILLFPDSRLAKKKMPSPFLSELVEIIENHGLKPTTAFFQKTIAGFDKQAIGYDNFNALVALINHANFVITADSLVAHLCELLHKPHFIYYSEMINQEWITPFSLQHNYAAKFYETDSLATLLKNCLDQ